MMPSAYIVLCVLISSSLIDAKPADCDTLQNVVPSCDCQGATDNENNIVIRCQNLVNVPQINGNYSGLIHEFSLKDNNNIRTLPENAFHGLRIQILNLYGTRLNNISNGAFEGLQNDLQELSISGDDASDVLPPFVAIQPLKNLTRLHIHRFKPNNNDIEGTHLFSFQKLQQLTLESMKIKSMGSDVFYLPQLTTLRLVDNLFTTFPSDAIHTLTNLQYLTVTDNTISAIPSYFFERIRNIKYFDVSRNNISLLEDDCFIYVTSTLQTLILNQNPLSTASKLSRVSDINSLLELRIQHVGLKEIPSNPEFLRNKNQLKYLYLNGNQILRLNGNEFVSVANNLVQLDLSGNQISSIESNTFFGMSKLTNLQLEDQTAAGKLILPSFSSLKSLQKLDLQSTKLDTNTAWEQIRHLTNLQSLNLDSTGLNNIADLVFRDITNLSLLSLSQNNITNVTQEMFVGLRDSLNILYLDGNKIQTIHSCTFDNFSRKITLSLSNNPLHCDCHLKWLKDKITNQNISFVSQSEKCSSPSRNANKDFTSVPETDFVCIFHTTEPICPNYYLSTTSGAPPVTTEPPVGNSTLPVVVISLSLLEATLTNIKIQYGVSNLENVNSIAVRYTNIKTQDMRREPLSQTETMKTIYGLDMDTRYEICISVETTQNHIVEECKIYSTKKDPLATTVDPMPSKQDGNDTGVIIGAVIGGIVLVCLLVAILYLVFVKSSNKNKKIPSEHVVPTRASVPRIGYDSKRFMKKKKANGNNNTQSPDDIQVSVVTDGQGNPPNLGRISAGSYQYLDKNQPSKVNTKPSGDYMNGNETRPLPTTPHKNHSYQNEAFQRSPSESYNTYSEIDV
ncbi:slit homolog 3 protein [Patella vulgata]|uniref:slit homolog 3 protein n=1 Tax=Patella vulgata TaxID=6465 RepID=UPI00217FBC1B|nr:slit homolog 3 protein [Patella vulgata]